ncbi:hypothetical protein JKG68_10770 [Microvirga aerilata]|uniref:Uncharacterized protein n=1 Tax=Microvirga aerilata TaxID=670292 RepID=A0A936Z775_9HYPH|nr:hypothetical protein [Microvirga aerilata]
MSRTRPITSIRPITADALPSNVWGSGMPLRNRAATASASSKNTDDRVRKIA